MKTMALERTSAAKAGWVFLGLLGAWIVFLFLPGPTPEPPPKPVTVPTLASKLVTVGLPADPDLEALPLFFPVWADRAEWKDGKTRFAYKHPVSGEFSFFFEATKTSDGFRFREIPKPTEPSERMIGTDELSEDCPFGFFITNSLAKLRPVISPTDPQRGDPPQPESSKIPIDIGSPKAKFAAPTMVPVLKPVLEEKKPTR